MFQKVFSFVKMPLIVIFLIAMGRFITGISGIPYAPRGNAMFSIVNTMLLSSLYFGALSSPVGRFSWTETVLIGLIIAEFAEILIWIMTFVSLVGNFQNSYFIHWDSLNVREGAEIGYWALIPRTVALFTAPIPCIILACLGRFVFSRFIPLPAQASGGR